MFVQRLSALPTTFSLRKPSLQPIEEADESLKVLSEIMRDLGSLVSNYSAVSRIEEDSAFGARPTTT